MPHEISLDERLTAHIPNLQILREDLERARVNRNALACTMDEMEIPSFEGDGRCQAQLDEYDAEIRSLETRIAATVKEEARKNVESDALGCPFAQAAAVMQIEELPELAGRRVV